MRILLAAGICLLCTGCLKYQYVTIRSSFEKKNQKTLTYENDSLKLSYDFSGADGPLKIQIYNKLDIPIYVDWSKSALVLEEERHSYYSSSSSVIATTQSSQTNWNNTVSSQSGEISGIILNDELISFIPPKSFLNKRQMTIKDSFFKIGSNQFRTTQVNNIKVKQCNFTPASTPFMFRSYLTLSTTDKFESQIIFDHQFWVSDIIQTLNSPDLFKPNNDQFHTNEVTGIGVFFGILLLGGLAILNTGN